MIVEHFYTYTASELSEKDSYRCVLYLDKSIAADCERIISSHQTTA